MANKKKGGRTTPKGTRPPDRRQSRLDDGTPPIVRDAEDACKQRDPLALMLMASTICETLTKRPIDELRDEAENEHVDFEQLASSFVMSGFPAMETLARGMVVVHPDRLAATELFTMLPDHVGRPLWATSMGSIEITGALLQTEIMGDGDNIVISLMWPSGAPATVIVYVDHNMGTAVKDGFVIPVSHQAYQEIVRQEAGDEIQIESIDLADARARIEGAIEHFEHVWPPLESDTWPGCRPFVEWVLTHLPEGGSRYERPEFTVDERQAVLDAFVAEHGGSVSGLTADEVSRLAAPLIAFACDVGAGDPLRWSAVAVEMALFWYAAEVDIIDDELMPRLPDVLEQLVLHAHSVRAIPAELTGEMLANLVAFTPHYLEALDDDSITDDSLTDADEDLIARFHADRDAGQ